MKIPDYSAELEHLIKQADLVSEEELIEKAGVSALQISRLRRGLALQTPVGILLKISQALKLPLAEFLAIFASDQSQVLSTSEVNVQLEQEYRHLQSQMVHQREVLYQQFQIEALNILESWLLAWPTVVQKVKENPQLEGRTLIPLVRPVERLIQEWGITSLGAVGTQVRYDPQFHELLEGRAEPGDLVKIRYTGYQQGEQLLYRAKVSPVGQVEDELG